MSLKAFHILFVSVSTALCLFVAVWAWSQADSAAMSRWLGIGSLLGAFVLPAYGWWFLKKTKDVGFI